MISKPITACIIAAFLAAGALAEKPATPKPSTPKPAVTPRPPQNGRPSSPVPTPIRIAPKNTPAPAISTPVPPKSTPAPATEPAPSDPSKPGEGEEKPPEKVKGPTIITSQKAKFDQRANLAIFIGDVFVDDPDFKVHCDKLTAFLTPSDTAKPAATPAGKPGVKPAGTPAPGASATPAPATPVPATPVPGEAAAGTPAPAPGATPEPAPKKKSSLRKAVAEVDPGKRVIINQDKVEDDGTITHGLGRADKAVYDTETGDITLYGTPEVYQGGKSVVAVDPDAIIILNRDGHMWTKGMTKTTIENTGEER